MKEKRLLILGSSEEFTDLIREAVSRGIYTVVLDGYTGNPGKQFASASYDVSVFDTEAAAEIARRERADAILTAYSDVLFEQSVKIAAAAGLPYYIRPEQLPFYRDKNEQKKLMKQAGIGAPASVLLMPDFDEAALGDLSFPLVIKPLDGYGTKGVYVVHSPAELREYFPLAQAGSARPGVLAEEYVPWPEYNSMAWVHEGEVTVLSVNDRERTPRGPHQVPVLSRIVYPSRHLPEFYDEVKAAYTAFVRAAGQTEGPVSLQFFWKKGHPLKVCEFAGRCLAYEHELFDYVAHLSLPGLFLDSVYDPERLGRTLRAHDCFFPKTVAGIYYVAEEKKITDCSACRRIAAWPGVLSTAIYYREGETYRTDGYYAYPVRYFIGADTRAGLDALTERIYRTAQILGPEGENILFPFRLPEETAVKPRALHTLEEFTGALASDAPAPGGGGAGALTAALAASLASMVGAISRTKAKDERRERLDKLAGRAEELRQKFIAAVDGDETAFIPLSAAYRLPKDAPDRAAVLESALNVAADAPFSLIPLLGETAQLLRSAAEDGSRLVLSDVICGAHLTEAALKIAAVNVRVNTALMKDRERAQALEQKTEALLAAYIPPAREAARRAQERF